jgi:hypothetical protein
MFRLTFDLRDGFDAESRWPEIWRILREVSHTIEQKHKDRTEVRNISGNFAGPVHDINGNHVGEYEVS